MTDTPLDKTDFTSKVRDRKCEMTSEEVEQTDLMTTLKRHRLAKGLTLRDLAKRIGSSAAACSSWETGRYTPSARLIPKLARVLGVEPLELTRLISPDRVPLAASA